MTKKERLELYEKFEKVAGALPPSALSSFKNVLKQWLPLAALGIGMGAGLRLVPEAISKLMAHKSFRQIMQSDEYSPDEKERIVEAFSILNKYAPALAEHPAVAKSFVDAILRQPPGVSLHDVVRKLIETESSVRRGTTESLFSGLHAVPGVKVNPIDFNQ